MKNNEIQERALPACPMNEGVACDPKKRNCDKCGWNPEVAKARLITICSKNRLQIPCKNGEFT